MHTYVACKGTPGRRTHTVCSRSIFLAITSATNQFCVPLYGLWLTYRSHGDTSNDLPFHHSYSIFLFWTCMKQTCQALLGSQRACARCITASANICSTHQLQTWHAEQQATKVCLEKQRNLYELQRKCIFAAPKH